MLREFTFCARFTFDERASPAFRFWAFRSHFLFFCPLLRLMARFEKIRNIVFMGMVCRNAHNQSMKIA